VSAAGNTPSNGGGNGPGAGSVSFLATTFRHSGTLGDIRSNNKTQALKRCESAVAGGLTGLSPSESTGANNSSSLKKQGTDYLVEIDGKALSIYGQGALKHTLMVQILQIIILETLLNRKQPFLEFFATLRTLHTHTTYTNTPSVIHAFTLTRPLYRSHITTI